MSEDDRKHAEDDRKHAGGDRKLLAAALAVCGSPVREPETS